MSVRSLLAIVQRREVAAAAAAGMGVGVGIDTAVRRRIGTDRARVPVRMVATSRTLRRRPSGEGIGLRRKRTTTGRISGTGHLGNRNGISTIEEVRRHRGGVPVRWSAPAAAVTEAADEDRPPRASHDRARATITARRHRIEVEAGHDRGIGHEARPVVTPVVAGHDHRRVFRGLRRSSTSRRRLPILVSLRSLLRTSISG